MTADAAERSTIDQERLATILANHQRWLDTKGNEGVQADLSNLDLRERDFQGANLQNAILRDSDLSGANLKGMNLKDCTLRGANLTEAQLQDARLCDADLCGATLHEVNLTTAHGLVEHQLAGTDLSNAELPVGLGKFDALGKVTDVSVQARTLLWVTVGACLFAMITMFITTDSLIIAQSGLTLLPLVNINVPVFKFFLVWPLILLGLYMYLHFQLQYLWSGLASLPSVFPDGVSLDEKAYPLFLVGLVRWHIPILRKYRPPLYRLQGAAAIGAVWGLVPFTLILFWLDYVRVHDWWGTSCHLIAFLVAALFGLASYGSARQTLRGVGNPSSRVGERNDQERTRRVDRFLRWAAIAVVFLAVGLSAAAFYGCSHLREWISADINYGEISHEPDDWQPTLRKWIRKWTSADIGYGEISHKPDDWNRSSDDDSNRLKGVKGALLEEVNLQGSNARGAFLAKAILVNANLQAADFSEADLRESSLNQANLQETQLGQAKLQGAHLTGAQLQCANLRNAELTGAKLDDAKLNGANLYCAKLQNASLTKAACQAEKTCCDKSSKKDTKDLCEKTILAGAKLQGADFGDAHLENAILTCANLARAKLRKADLNGADFSGAWFQETELQGADLSTAKNLDKEQLSGAYHDADTKLPPGLEKKPLEK